MSIMATTAIGGTRGDLDDLAARAWDHDYQEQTDVYASAPWPELNADAKLGAINVQGKPLPEGLSDGHIIQGAPLQADRVTVVVFWGTWCGPSLRAVEVVEGVSQLYGRKLQPVAMAGQDERRKAVQNYLETNSIGCTIAVDERQTLYRALDVEAIPMALVVSTDGVVRWQGNPLDPRFNEAVRRVVDADPGVAWRKKKAA
ncbi:MAG: TlpA disulfide reductase family protein [Planctomycetota bacterium]